MAIRKGIIVGIGLILQILLSLCGYIILEEILGVVSIVYTIIGLLLILSLIRNSKSYSYTLPWILILFSYPLVGTLMYIIIGRNKNNSKVLKNIIESEKNSKNYLIQDAEIREEIKDNGKIRYLSDFSGYPVTKNNDVEYFPLGEDAFKSMLEELKKAEKFIFFEYFIVQPR